MIVVSDASVFMYLGKVGLLDLLRCLYGAVLTPETVWREVTRGNDEEEEIPAVLAAREAGWIEVAEPETTSPWLAALLDPGEVAAITLALERNADLLLVDDGSARKVAETAGLRIRGTMGVLLSAKRSGLVPEIGTVLQQLLELGFRIDERIVLRILTEAGEPLP